MPRWTWFRRRSSGRREVCDLAERALTFVRTLPDQQREVILLRATEGLSYREIAEILGTSEGSCRVSYHHGMAKLRGHLIGPGRSEETAGTG